MSARRKKAHPQRIGGFLEALFEKWGIAEQVERAGAAARWEEIVGPRIAGATRSVRLGGRTLFVEVESAAWVQELSMMRHRILAKLNAGRRRGRIEKIVFLQAGGRGGGRPGPAPRRGRRAESSGEETTRGRGESA